MGMMSRRFLCLLCTVSLVASMVPASALAEEAVSAEEIAAVAATTAATAAESKAAPLDVALVAPSAAEEDAGDPRQTAGAGDDLYHEEFTDTFTAETSAEAFDGIAAYALDAAGFVALKKGNYEKWVDRVEVPDYARDFYRVLEEATDNDGDRDFLIEDRYFDGSAVSEGAYRNERGNLELLVVSVPIATEEEGSSKATEFLLYTMAMLAAFDRDHPEVFWLGRQYETHTTIATDGSGKGTASISLVLKGRGDNFYTKDYNIRANGYASEAVIKSDIERRDQWVESIVNARPVPASTKETLAYFNKHLTHHNEYNTSPDLDALAKSGAYPQAWECISALEGCEGTRGPVCEGYARAFKMLCNEVGIPCVLVDGYGMNFSGSGPHMWNNVKVDGAWYAVDVTWNDPAGGKPGKLSGAESEEWFLLGSESLVLFGNSFSDTHQVQNLVFPVGPMFTNGPVLSKTAYGVAPSKPTPSTPTPSPGTPSGNAGGSSTGTTAKPSAPTQPAKKPVKKPSVFKVKLSKVRSTKKKTATVQWKRPKGKVSGYQVQVALNKKFKKGLKKQTVKKAKTTKVTIKKLKSKKTYYVRVRAYYKTGGKTYFGKWSAIKKVKVK